MAVTNTNEEKEDNRIYEVGFLISSNISEDKVGEELEKIKTIFEKNGSFFISEDFPKLRQLAYTMVKRLGGKNLKISNAYFGWVKFELPGGNIGKIKKELDAVESIVRFILIRTVRENIVSVPRMTYSKRPELTTKKEAVKVAEQKHETGMTDAELDKTIADLVVE